MTLPPEIQNILARLLLILLVLLVTLFLRRMATGVARRILRQVWRVINTVRRSGSVLDRQITIAITPPLRYLITIIGLYLVVLLLELPVNFQRLQMQVMTSLVAFAIFWTFYRLVDIVTAYFEASRRFSLLDTTIVNFANQVTKALIILFLFIVIMSSFGFDLGGVIAGLGIGGLAVALAAQDALANLIGYFVIVSDAPFKVGHYIVVNSVEGSVEAITFRSTRLRMRDRAQIVIPNQTIVNSTIVNWSRVDRRQIRTTLGVTYSTTEAQLRAVIADLHTMLDAHERVIQDEQRVIQFVDYGASSLDILILFYINTTSWDDLQAIKSDVNFRIMSILQTHGVGVAFPTTTINFDGSAHELVRANREVQGAQQ